MQTLVNLRLLVAIRQQLLAEGISMLAQQEGFNVQPAIENGSIRSFMEIYGDKSVLVCDVSNLAEITRCRGDAEFWSFQKIVVVSSDEELRQNRAIPVDSAAGWVSTDSGFQFLAMAIESVFYGKDFVSPCLENALSEIREPVEQQLTPRQRQILQLIAAGHTSRRIGLDLGISPSTVENHRARMMRKFGAKSSMELLRIALENNLL